MSSDIEIQSIELVNQIISNPDLPIDRIKNLKLTWVEIYSELVPDLQIDFYEEKET